MPQEIKDYIVSEAKNLSNAQLFEWWAATRAKWLKCERNNWKTEYIKSLFLLIDKLYKDRIGGVYYV